MKAGHVILNGALVPRDAARIDIDDLGFLLGDGTFETLRAYRGVPFLIEEHLARLFASLRALEIAIPWKRDQLLAQVRLLLERNGAAGGDTRLRITVTRGTGSTPTVLLTADPYTPPDAALYDRGVQVAVSRWTRAPHPLYRVKATSAQWFLWQRREDRTRDVFDVLQLNTAGRLAEGSFTNVFSIDAEGVIRTPHPDDGCLKGVTRNAVLTIAGQTGMAVREGDLTEDELRAAREVFLTNSLVEIVPVRAVDGRPVAACPGPTTRALRTAYAAFVRTVVGEGAAGEDD